MDCWSESNAEPVTIGRADLARGHALLRASIRDQRRGIYGPGSHNWRLNRETINMLGGGRAILMQLAHPYVAFGVDEHSATREDARGRFRRTFKNIFAMSFGDLPMALTAAERVFQVHARVHGVLEQGLGVYPAGHRYRANDAGALFWVHATLVDSVIAVRRALYDDLSAAELEGYYQESKRYAHLFGIPAQFIPDSYASFTRYMDHMVSSSELAVGSLARELGGFVLRAPAPVLWPAARLYRLITAGLLPEQLRDGYGFAFGRRQQRIFARSTAALAAMNSRMPRQLRYMPGYLEAESRLGMGPRLPLGRVLDRVAMTGLGLWPRTENG